jgi:hypothetical protein
MQGELLYVKRTAFLTCAVVLSLGVPSALAQYHGGGGHHDVASASGPTPDTRSGDIKGFERVVALQATPDQIVQFRQLRASTQSVRTRAQDLLQLPASTPKSEWIHNTYPMTTELEEALAENERFLQNFSKEQKDGLKKFSKKLQKTDSAITNHSKALSRGLESDAVSGEQIAEVIEKLRRALDEFQSEQLAIAAEMGIQTTGIAN